MMMWRVLGAEAGRQVDSVCKEQRLPFIHFPIVLAASGPRPFHECTMGSLIQKMLHKPIEYHHASMRVGRQRLHSNNAERSTYVKYEYILKMITAQETLKEGKGLERPQGRGPAAWTRVVRTLVPSKAAECAGCRGAAVEGCSPGESAGDAGAASAGKAAGQSQRPQGS